MSVEYLHLVEELDGLVFPLSAIICSEKEVNTVLINVR